MNSRARSRSIARSSHVQLKTRRIELRLAERLAILSSDDLLSEEVVPALEVGRKLHGDGFTSGEVSLVPRGGITGSLLA